MRIVLGVAYLLAGTGLLLGCASLPPSPSVPGEIELSVVEPEHPCATLPPTVSIGLSIANKGRGPFRTYIDTLPGPPYKLSWLSYAVLRESPTGRDVEWEHGAGDHGPMPQNTLALGPDDSTRVFANIYSTAEMDKTAAYRIQVEDHDDQIYLSNVFTICRPNHPAGRPSN